MSHNVIDNGMPSVRHSWLAVSSAGLATFAVVTTEMLPVGLLTTLAQALNTSTGSAGMAVSLPALLAALFAPLVVIGSGEIDRRIILRWLLVLLVVANLASALATGMATLLAARVLVGFCMGGIWAIAGGLSSRLVPPRAVGLASAVVFGGVAMASVLGVPLGVVASDTLGWRWTFVAMAVFSLAVLALQIIVMPALPVHHRVSPGQLVTVMRHRGVQAGILLTLTLVTGHFMAFTFVRPLLLEIAPFGVQWLGILLFVYGMAGVVGNFLIGIMAVRRTALALLTIALGLLLTPLLFLTLGHSGWGAVMALVLWGLAYGGVSVGLMSWMINAAPRSAEPVAALYVAVFNIGIAAGAWSGGQIVDRLGLVSNLSAAAVLLALAALLSLYLSLRRAAPGGRQTAGD